MFYKRIHNGNILFEGALFSANADMEKLASLVAQIPYTLTNPRAKNLHEKVSEISCDVVEDFGFLIPLNKWVTPAKFATIIQSVYFGENLKVRFYCEILNAL